MMGDRFESADKPIRPVTTTAASETTGPEPTTQHVELEPTLEPVVAPDTDTSSTEPTATGPLTPASRPLMAIESESERIKRTAASEPLSRDTPSPKRPCRRCRRQHAAASENLRAGSGSHFAVTCSRPRPANRGDPFARQTP